MPKKSAPKRPAKKKTAKRPGPAAETTQRLQRFLAAAGFGSRRRCEELIEAGRVDVDGTIVTKLGSTVDPSTQKVRVDGVLLKKQKLVYFAVNKPVGVVTTNRDPHGRPRVIDLVPPSERVFPVGRLDRSSEGLILLTNDGDLAQKLTHPKFGVRKVYRVTVAGKVDTETMRKMRQGIYIADGFVRVEGAKLLKARSRSTEMEIVLREGKNREIRRILARLGHKVQHLRRIAVGPLRLGDIPPGAYRIVTPKEVEKLWAVTEATPDDEPKRHAVKGAVKRTSKRTGRPSTAPGRPSTAPGRPSTAPGRNQPAKNQAGQKKAAPGKRAVKKKSSTASSSFSFETAPTRGAVIGGDAPEPSKTKTRSSGSKRTTKKRVVKKRTTKKQATKTRGNPKKTSGPNRKRKN